MFYRNKIKMSGYEFGILLGKLAALSERDLITPLID